MMTDREEFEKLVETQSPLALREYTFAQSAWQARGELDAVRIKELEKDRDEWKDSTITANQRFKLAENKVAELTAKNKVAEESELLALRNNDGLRAQIAELTAKLDKAKEALQLLRDGEGLLTPIEQILKELDK